jgi:hypothetical protein
VVVWCSSVSPVELPKEVDIKEKFVPAPEYSLVGFYLTGYLVEGFLDLLYNKGKPRCIYLFLIF